MAQFINRGVMKNISILWYGIYLIGSMLLGATLAGCTNFAAPPPMITFDGPKTVKSGHWQLGIGTGTGVVLFPKDHAGGHSYFARWRRGFTERWDAGLDIMGVQHNENGTFTLKSSLRFQAAEWLRLEGGLGAADDSDGKSLGVEFGIIAGTMDDTAPWRFYGGIRLAGALGLNGEGKRHPGGQEEPHPADALIPLLTTGASVRISENSRFISEMGYGLVFVEDADTAQAVYVGVGLLYDINQKREKKYEDK